MQYGQYFLNQLLAIKCDHQCLFCLFVLIKNKFVILKVHYRIYNIHYFQLKFISSLFSWHCYQGNMDENSVDLKILLSPFSPLHLDDL